MIFYEVTTFKLYKKVYQKKNPASQTAGFF